MLNHADIWRAIDRLAERHGFSPSGLARKAGLSPTIFNPSKRINGKRKRWPSTESIAAILKATGSSLDEFVALSSAAATQHTKLLVSSLAKAAEPLAFDEAGLPAGQGWDDMPLPAATDAQAFVLEITGRSLEPAYREGDRIILSPAEKPRRGDRVALRTATGEIFVKLLGQEGAQKIELLPLNADEQPLTLARKDIGWMYRIVWASQ